MTDPKRDDRDMSTLVHSWLSEGDEPAADRNRHIGRIMGRVDETRQRRRLWPLNPFGRRALRSATGTDATNSVAAGRTNGLAPARTMVAAGLAIFLATALLWVSTRPQEAPALPGGWEFDPADEALFERMVTLWASEESDLVATLEVYADDAIYDALWLDDVEATRGSVEIASRMRQSRSIDWTQQRLIQLPDDLQGGHRYLLTSPPVDGTACVLWIAGERITRHDCILPESIAQDGVPDFGEVTPSATAAREELSAKLVAALESRDRARLEGVVSAEIAHHVLSANQHYTLEGIDEYWSVMWAGGPSVAVDVDLPAPDGEQRWANFSSVGSGALCVFWAQDDLIVRHDCVVAGITTAPAPRLAEPG